MSDVTPRTWEAVHFDLDEDCFGFVLRDSDSAVHAYERAGRRLVPCFSRFEHAELFVAQWAERPKLTRGPSYDLSLLDEPEADEAVGAEAEGAWLLVLDVLDAIGEGSDLELPVQGLPDESERREGLERFVRALDQLDRAED